MRFIIGLVMFAIGLNLITRFDANADFAIYLIGMALCGASYGALGGMISKKKDNE